MPTESLPPGVVVTVPVNTPYSLPPGPCWFISSTVSVEYATTIDGAYTALVNPNVEPGNMFNGGFVRNVAGGQRLFLAKKITRLDNYAGKVGQGNPLSFYRFNEQTGTIMYDSVNINHLTKGAAAVLGVTGPLGDNSFAVTFDGTINSVLGTSSGVNTWFGASAISFEAWINNPAFAAGHEMVISLGGLGEYMSIDTGRLIMSIFTSAQFTNRAINAMSAAEWHHVACTWQTGDQIRLYVDGAEVAGDNNTVRTGTLDNSPNIFIGAFNGGSLFFSGNIADPAIYLRKLSADEIRRHWSSRMVR